MQASTQMAETAMRPGPLVGMRMIELGMLLAGPFAGRLLGDMGAEVVKVEAPGQPDPLRDWGHARYEGRSLWWPVQSRNKKCITLNLRGTYLTCRAFAAAVEARGRGGRIVAISSQMGEVGFPGRAAYCASKHAVNGLVRALAVEWAPAGILVNAVAPTFVETPLTRPMLEDEAFRAEVLRRLPIGRIGTPSDVVGAVVYLASDQAALVTGHILDVDGGWTAW